MEQPAQQQLYVSPQGNTLYQGQLVYNALKVQVSAVGTGPRVIQAYSHRQSMGLGVTQVIIGIICIIINSVLLGFYVRSFPYFVYGMLCGIIFVISGSFGIVAAKTKNYCMIVTFMVMSIISAVNSGAQFGYSISGLFVVTIGTIILAFVNGILAIWSSVICCKAVCCCSTNGDVVSIGSTQQVPVNPYQYNTSPQMMYVTQQQQQQVGQFTQYPGVPTCPLYNGYAYPTYWPQLQGMSVVPPPYMPSTNMPPPQGGYATTAPHVSNEGQVNLSVPAAYPDKS